MRKSPRRPRSWLLLGPSLLATMVAVASGASSSACAAQQRPDGGSGLLQEGAKAPPLTGLDQAGKRRDLSAERGKVVVVYFYPADGTPGCTAEACAFRDVWEKYQKAGIVLYGVSSNSVEDHAGFAKEYELPFALIADTDGKWAEHFGVGSTVGFYSRVSFLLGPDGKVAKVYPNVDPGVHAEQVLKDATAIR